MAGIVCEVLLYAGTRNDVFITLLTIIHFTQTNREWNTTNRTPSSRGTRLASHLHNPIDATKPIDPLRG